MTEAYLEQSRRFWNADTVEQAKLAIHDSREMREATPELRQAIWDVTAHRTAGKIIENLPIRSGWFVVDVGCGIGRLMKVLSPHFAWIDGIDISPEMVRLSKGYLADCRNCDVFLGDGTTLFPVAESHNDLVYSVFTFQHIHSLSIVRSYLSETRRILKPGGWFRLQVQQPSEALGNWDEEPEPGREYEWRGNGYRLDEIRQIVRDAGLEVIQVTTPGSHIWITARKPK